MTKRNLLTTCLLTILAFAASIGAYAQEAGEEQPADITKYYLTNYGFDTDFDYTADRQATVTQEIKEIKGWTPDLSANYTITGVYEFGFPGTWNKGNVPAKGYDGEAGGALALSTGWGQTFCYYQTITLPKGTYTVTVPTYNSKTVTGGTSKLAWIPNTGTTGVASTVKSYKSKQWTVDQITFTLTTSTTGKLQIGYQAASGSSDNSANLLIDYVKLTATGLTVNKTKLRSNINTANRLYTRDNGEGKGAESLKALAEAAEAVRDNAEATMPEVLEANYNLEQAITTYNWENASETYPVDQTSYIQNPSFETDGTANWTVSNMKTQSNTVFSRKDGTYYLESWVNIGQQIGRAKVCQTLKGLPKGKYQLIAVALHIQQSGSNSTTNKGTPQTGAWLYAGAAKTAITAIKQYTLPFTVVDEQSDVEIGLLAEDATGNYLCVDNFKLRYVGEVTPASYAQEVQNLVTQGEELIAKGIQNSAAEPLRTAIEEANRALQGIGTDEGENIIYDVDALSSARTNLLDGIEQGQASRLRYETLQKRIDYAEKVVTWWEGDTHKADALTQLKDIIQSSKELMTDYTLTNIQLGTNTLDKRIKAVDKQVYCSSNACGTESQLRNAANQWCYDRSLQSKHWILFWEAGYGTDVPAAVPGILEKADQIFEFYANDLKFITINEGTSKTDTYKMIIRLRYTTTWEASGSGIDNTIGLLTLSNGAHTSRSGQTVAHEIGHCFQYQTHCDNNNNNGWMYNWGNSTYNVFWEMCAQWQAYKFYPDMQFVWNNSAQGNDWLGDTLNGLHRHPLSVGLRYNNYFIQDYFCHKHGMDILGRLWNESKSPEDPLQAYMRLTMDASLTSAQKLQQLNDEMWEYGARMTTFDLDPIREKGANTIGKRNQPTLLKDNEDFWSPSASFCIENFGNNAIRLNAPTTAKTIYVEFVGEAGKDGYTAYNTRRAGWRYGFVALLKDNTRVYGDMASATYSNPDGTLAFECPANCKYVWFVVSGAPTSYWTRDWLTWDGDNSESTAEQWPYKVKFFQTNVYGQTNNNDLPTGIDSMIAGNTDPVADNNVYSITGQVVRRGSTSLEGLPGGIYIVKGRKVMVK